MSRRRTETAQLLQAMGHSADAAMAATGAYRRLKPEELSRPLPVAPALGAAVPRPPSRMPDPPKRGLFSFLFGGRK